MKAQTKQSKTGWACLECGADVSYTRPAAMDGAKWLAEMIEQHKLISPKCRSKKLEFKYDPFQIASRAV